MPLFSTPTQFAALALIFVAGWLFGLASHPGGKKAKARLREVEANTPRTARTPKHASRRPKSNATAWPRPRR